VNRASGSIDRYRRRDRGRDREHARGVPLEEADDRLPHAARLETLQDNVRAWPAPSLLVLRDTTLGAAPFPFFYPAPKVIRDGVAMSAPIPERWQFLPMQDQFDALLYLGPPEGITFAQMPPALCSDKSYMDKRLSRMGMAALSTQTERLKEYCAGARRE
jgi:hypothetical protein